MKRWEGREGGKRKKRGKRGHGGSGRARKNSGERFVVGEGASSREEARGLN
jgi:hypothetical protein